MTMRYTNLRFIIIIIIIIIRHRLKATDDCVKAGRLSSTQVVKNYSSSLLVAALTLR